MKNERCRYSNMHLDMIVGDDKGGIYSSVDTIDIPSKIEEIDASNERVVEYLDSSFDALVRLKNGLIEALREFGDSI